MLGRSTKEYRLLKRGGIGNPTSREDTRSSGIRDEEDEVRFP
jgi:hypothetical protein